MALEEAVSSDETRGGSKRRQRGDPQVCTCALAAKSEVELETDRRRVCRGRHADAASLLADFDHDGRVGTNEIQQIKENLHHFFDIDDSGAIDPAEIQTVGLGVGVGTCMGGCV